MRLWKVGGRTGLWRSLEMNSKCDWWIVVVLDVDVQGKTCRVDVDVDVEYLYSCGGRYHGLYTFVSNTI